MLNKMSTIVFSHLMRHEKAEIDAVLAGCDNEPDNPDESPICEEFAVRLQDHARYEIPEPTSLYGAMLLAAMDDVDWMAVAKAIYEGEPLPEPASA